MSKRVPIRLPFAHWSENKPSSFIRRAALKFIIKSLMKMGIFKSKVTHKFKLLSGVEAEILELDASHQEMLTKQAKGVGHADKLNDILKDVLVRVGSVKTITDDFVQGMLTEDRRYALTMARQFSFSFQETFEHIFEYDDDGRKQSCSFGFDLSEEGTFPIKLYANQVKEYADINKIYSLTLPRSKALVEWSMLDGSGEKIGIGKKKSERSSNTVLEMRKPRYWVDSDGDKEGYWAVLPLNELSLADITALRQDIKDKEGKVDTEIKFEHPLWESGKVDEQWVVVDVLSTVNFFFPTVGI